MSTLGIAKNFLQRSNAFPSVANAVRSHRGQRAESNHLRGGGKDHCQWRAKLDHHGGLRRMEREYRVEEEKDQGLDDPGPNMILFSTQGGYLSKKLVLSLFISGKIVRRVSDKRNSVRR